MLTLTFRKSMIFILIIIFVAATVVTLVPSAGSPPLLIAGGIVALFSIIQGIQWLKEFGPERRPRHIEKMTAVSSPEELERKYLTGRLGEFAAEQKLFVKTELTTDLQPQYRTEGEVRQETFDDIQRAVELHKGRFVLVGDPGAGKSTALRRLFTETANRHLTHQEHRLPVWINLGLSSNPVDAAALLSHWWHEQCYLPGEPEQYLRQKNLCLFLDGLNEMPDAGAGRKQRAAALRSFIESHPDLPIMVTCRIRDYQDDDDLKLGLPVVYVQPLDDSRIQQFIDKRGVGENLWAAVQSSDALLRLARNPYNLVMLIEVYQETGGLPANLNDLYRAYLRITYNRYTAERAIRKDGDPNTELLRLKLPELESRLKRLAFLMIGRGKGTAAEYNWARQQVGRTGLRDGLNLGVLVREGENIRFYHQSLHGYFALPSLTNAITQRWHYLIRYRIGLIIFQPHVWLHERYLWLHERIDYSRLDHPLTSLVQFCIKIYSSFSDFVINLLLPAPHLIRKIGDLGEAAAPVVPTLVQALQNPRLRYEAIIVLARIGIPARVAIVPLIEILRDEAILDEWNWVTFILETLISIGPADIGDLPILVAMLGDTRGDIRYVAVYELGIMGSVASPAVTPLIGVLQDTDYEIREQAAMTLGKIGFPAGQAVPALIRAFKEGSGSNNYSWRENRLLKDTAQAAWRALQEIGAPPLDCIPALKQFLKEENGYVSNLAVDALGKMGPLAASAAADLAEYLRDRHPEIGAAAMRAFRQIGEAATTAVPILVESLESEDLDVRRLAVSALKHIGTPEAKAAVAAWWREQKNG